jgi:hypothetical protein
MNSLEELLREVATFKTTRRGGVRLVDDRGDLIVEWPKGCPEPPTTRDEAITKALGVMRERGFDR